MKTDFDFAATADLPRLTELVKAYYAYDGIPWTLEIVLPSLEALVCPGNPYGEILVVRADTTEILGYLILTWGYSVEFGGRYAFIDEFYLDSSARGAGIGSGLFDRACERAKELGIKALHVEVETENKSAFSFYQARGFSSHGRHLLSQLLLD